MKYLIKVTDKNGRYLFLTRYDLVYMNMENVSDIEDTDYYSSYFELLIANTMGLSIAVASTDMRVIAGSYSETRKLMAEFRQEEREFNHKLAFNRRNYAAYTVISYAKAYRIRKYALNSINESVILSNSFADIIKKKRMIAHSSSYLEQARRWKKRARELKRLKHHKIIKGG